LIYQSPATFAGMTNEITIRVGNRSRKVQAPLSWDALDDRTFLLFFSTLFANPGDEYTRTAFTAVKLISMTQMLLGIDYAFLAAWEAGCKPPPGEDVGLTGEEIFLDELRQVMHATLEVPQGDKKVGLFAIELDEDGGTTYAARLNRTRNVWPVLGAPVPAQGKKKKAQPTQMLYAPADKLANVTIYELGAAFALFEAYLSTNKEEYAYELLGTIYRPSRGQTKEERELGWKNDDRRVPFRNYEGQAKERAKLFKTLPWLTVRAILFWFAGCRQSIVEAYPKVFKKGGEGGNQGHSYGWGGVLLSIAGGPVGLEAVADQHYSNALTFLSMKDDEVVEMERRMEEAKRGSRR